jgi:hypothetical protein
MPDLPTGTVTFLFTDIEGSTRLWEQHPDAMRLALARHDDLLLMGFGGPRLRNKVKAWSADDIQGMLQAGAKAAGKKHEPLEFDHRYPGAAGGHSGPVHPSLRHVR